MEKTMDRFHWKSKINGYQFQSEICGHSYTVEYTKYLTLLLTEEKLTVLIMWLMDRYITS